MAAHQPSREAFEATSESTRPFLPRVPAMAAVEDVMWEQLAYLMDHGPCDPATCHECSRFGQVRVILLKIFTAK